MPGLFANTLCCGVGLDDGSIVMVACNTAHTMLLRDVACCASTSALIASAEFDGC